MNNLVEKASRFMDILARAAVAGIMFTTTLNVIMRLFGSSLRGSVEIVQYLTALGIGLGLAYCGFHGGHIAVTFFTDKLPLKLQQFIIVLVEILVAGFLGMAAWQMFLYGQGMQEKNEIALTLGFPIYPIVYLVTAGIVVFLFVVLNNLVKVTKGLFSATPAVKAADNISVDDLISQ